MSLLLLFGGGAAAAPPPVSYATWNPADKDSGITLSGDDLIATSAATTWKSLRATSSKTSGKWIFEVTGGAAVSNVVVGVATINQTLGYFIGDGGDDGIGYYSTNGGKVLSGAVTAYGASWGIGDVITVCLDLDGGELFFKKNGAAQPTITLPAFLVGVALFPAASPYSVGDIAIINCGQSAIQYPETGYSEWTA